MLAEIEAGKADGIICWALNRLFRNPIDEGRVRWMLQRGVIKSIRTATREYLPTDAGVLMAIEGGQASDELATLRRNVARGIEEKLLGGAWPGKRPPGYIYDYDLENIVPHPKLGKVVTQIFEECAVSDRSLMWVSDRLAQLGVFTQKGKKWGKSKVHWFLTNKLYIGIMPWNGKVYEGNYQALVTPEIFREVAKRLKKRSKPRKVRGSQEFPLRCIFKCACGAMLTAQIARGNGGVYRYYRCSRAKGKCNEPYIQENEARHQCAVRLSPLSLPPSDAKLVRDLFESLRVEDEKANTKQSDEVEAALISVQNELNNLTRACARLSIDDESYTTASTELLMKKASLKRKKEHVEATYGSSWFEPAMEVVEWLELATKQQSNPDVQDVAALVQKVGTNHVYSRKQVSFDLAEPYAFVAQLLARMRAPSGDAAATGSCQFATNPILLSLVDYLRTYFKRAFDPSGCPSEESNLLGSNS